MKTVKLAAAFLLLNTVFIILPSCSGVTYKEIYPILEDGKYDSEFPYKGASDALREISQTVHRINSTAFYKTYLFNRSAALTKENFNEKNLENITISEGYADQSTSGTGTAVFFSEGKIAILTCAHVVDDPDTIISFFTSEEGQLTEYIEGVFIKERQTIYAAGFPEGSEFEILVTDEKRDLAVIGRDYKSLSGLKFPVFNYPLGLAKELDWGSFVYVFGFPINYQMVTKAIVSNPNRDEYGSFLIDAVINNGMSGGTVLAIRDGVPNFEMVGIIQWVPEVEENVLAPKKLKNNERYNPIIPYEGEKYVQRASQIRYGIARVISLEAIKNFFQENKETLYEKKYFFEKFME
ncbi:MAG: serine protease [Ignavibacteria bacterium]|nr:serine protease [Ignavibacteria bacterium]MBT8381044.1 serine protease [Ignavibacteria bacterium]MBT8393047.1 serine protease [Ignavibacteria bacterium]NNJ52006.1 trypsin-like peptidase domain-containing protein [Ignavibacteriaceae bacterium]NNL19731.1 trypsin-like peptidase domain-containing protein [Ignavibacteriaceae bacterium]